MVPEVGKGMPGCGGMDLYIMCVHGKAFADIDKYLENGNHVQG